MTRFFLVQGCGVLCADCMGSSGLKGVELHRENIGDYKQTCHGCDLLLVGPKTEKWPELYSPGEFVLLPPLKMDNRVGFADCGSPNGLPFLTDPTPKTRIWMTDGESPHHNID